MANISDSLDEIMTIDGAIACSVVDYASGMLLGEKGSGVDLELAAAGNSQVVNAKLKTMKSLGIKGHIEDILITLDDHYHIIKPSITNDGLFVYVILDKTKANLALARRKVSGVEKTLKA